MQPPVVQPPVVQPSQNSLHSLCHDSFMPLFGGRKAPRDKNAPTVHRHSMAITYFMCAED